jgi:hypothetical protein
MGPNTIPRITNTPVSVISHFPLPPRFRFFIFFFPSPSPSFLLFEDLVFRGFCFRELCLLPITCFCDRISSVFAICFILGECKPLSSYPRLSHTALPLPLPPTSTLTREMAMLQSRRALAPMTKHPGPGHLNPR